MKSFRHFYQWILIGELRMDPAGGAFLFSVKAPEECPRRIAEWLAKRKVNKVMVDVLLKFWDDKKILRR